MTKESDMRTVEGKVAIVTGGNAGIGKATALLLGREGAAVVVAARRAEEGRAVEAQINAEGGRALFIRTDVTRADDVDNLVKATVEHFGKLDLAFNNAGIAQFGHTVVELDEAEWDNVMAVNLKGVFLCMKHQIPAMLLDRLDADAEFSGAFFVGFSLRDQLQHFHLART